MSDCKECDRPDSDCPKCNDDGDFCAICGREDPKCGSICEVCDASERHFFDSIMYCPRCRKVNDTKYDVCNNCMNELNNDAMLNQLNLPPDASDDDIWNAI